MDSDLPHCTVCLKPLAAGWKCKDHAEDIMTDLSKPMPVTPEMIEAGAKVWRETNAFTDIDDCVTRIYLAMSRTTRLEGQEVERVVQALMDADGVPQSRSRASWSRYERLANAAMVARASTVADEGGRVKAALISCAKIQEERGNGTDWNELARAALSAIQSPDQKKGGA